MTLVSHPPVNRLGEGVIMPCHNPGFGGEKRKVPDIIRDIRSMGYPMEQNRLSSTNPDYVRFERALRPGIRGVKESRSSPRCRDPKKQEWENVVVVKAYTGIGKLKVFLDGMQWRSPKGI